MSSTGFVQASEKVDLATRESAEELNLSNLGLKAMPELPEVLGGLLNLYLNSNRLQEISSSVWMLAQLKRLDLGNNRLPTLPAAISRLAQLAFLDASENRLTSLPSEISACDQLTELHLYGNRLVSLPDSLFRLERLEHLDLSTNQLQLLPPFFQNLAHLHTLDLSNNQLRSIPPDISRFSALRILDLSGNQLTSIPELSALSELEELYLDNNELQELPTEIAQLPHLRIFSAEGNHFEQLPGEFAKISSTMRIQKARQVVKVHITPGLERSKIYFAPVPDILDFFLAISAVGVPQLINLYYKRFHAACSVSLKFPNGTILELKDLSRKRALEVLQKQLSTLTEEKVTLDLAEGELQTKTDLAIQTILRVSEIELVPKTPGAQSIQFVNSNIVINSSIKEAYMDHNSGDTYNVSGQAGAVGREPVAHGNIFHQIRTSSGDEIDLPSLAKELSTLRIKMRERAVEPEQDEAIGAIATAEREAKNGNGSKVLESLAKAGKWTLDTAKEIGVNVAVEAIKTALGIK